MIDGNRLIDLGAGIAVTNAGTPPAAVVEAIGVDDLPAEEMEVLGHAITAHV